MDLWHLNNMKVILIFWTLNYVDCVPFSCNTFHIVHNWVNNFKISCTWISEKHDQTSINVANAFEFIG